MINTQIKSLDIGNNLVNLVFNEGYDFRHSVSESDNDSTMSLFVSWGYWARFSMNASSKNIRKHLETDQVNFFT